MNDKKRPPGPKIEVVVRKPGVTPAPTAAAPKPAAPAPAPAAAAPRPTSPAPRPVPSPSGAPSPRPAPVGAGPIASSGGAPRPGGRPGGPGGNGGPRGPGSGRPPGRFGPRTPRPPPTPEQIAALAKKERVPARIAKGDLEGKMRCHIWRKLHAEEAKRFDQVYTLMDKHQGLDFQDAFAVLQAGVTVEEYAERKARTKKKQDVKQARAQVSNEGVSQWLAKMAADKTELAVVQAERTVLDVLQKDEPVALNFERSGRIEKLKIVLLARRGHWEKVSNALERDQKLSQKPASIPRQPEKRPVSDPRQFLDSVGKDIVLTLRNGIQLTRSLTLAGPFDLLLGSGDEELLIPLHAIVRWHREGEAPSAPAASPES